MSGAGRNKICLFKRNEIGKSDKNETYRKVNTTKVNFSAGHLEVKGDPLFSYSRRTIATQKDYEK